MNAADEPSERVDGDERRTQSVPVSRSTPLVGGIAGFIGVIWLIEIGQGSVYWLPLGVGYGVVASVVFGSRAIDPGRGLVWGLGTGVLAWTILIGISFQAASVGLIEETTVDAFLPVLIRLLLGLGAPVGVAVGIWNARRFETSEPIDLRRALFAGGVAGIVGGVAFGSWMESVGMFSLVAELVGTTSPVVGRLVHFLVALFIGVTFGLLFQRDALGHGSSMAWGMAYGTFWWLLGGLTLFPLALGSPVEWTATAAGGELGSFVGHAVYGVLLGLIYSLLDRAWLVLFHDADPLNQSVTAPGIKLLRRAGWGVFASLAGGLLFGVLMWTTGDLIAVAELVGRSNPGVGFFIHMGISVIVGITYGLLFRYESPDVGSGVAWRLVYGLVWWFIGALTLFPTLLGAPLAWNGPAMAAALPSLIGHLIYGGATGGVFSLLERKQRAWAKLDPRIAQQQRTRRRSRETPAGAIWLFLLGTGVLVLLALL
ncbi:hypothetical protein [Natronorubrum sp. A-ect3]|uniref:hypothetical protein n=1 Tax=Natronorubrum sp. A-ect3 TaxID=3242698 RepID=UPI00359E331E